MTTIKEQEMSKLKELMCDEEPTGPCADCPYANWIDMYGKAVWGCNMAYPCRAEMENDALR